MDHREGIVDVDVIPSLKVEPESPTLVEEEEQAPTTAGMEINSQNSVQGHQTNDVGKLQQPLRVEVAQRTNGDPIEQIEATVPRPQPKIEFV
jgi:hypothetical protein